MADKLISLNEAVERGIEHLRRPGRWGGEMDHIKIEILFKDAKLLNEDGSKTPVKNTLPKWGLLYSPLNKAIVGYDPVQFEWVLGEGEADRKEFVAYTGPLPDSDEYKEEVNRCMQVYHQSTDYGRDT